jgi:hypothetical protein
MSNRCFLLSWVFLVLPLFLIGCGGESGPKTYPVSGTVAYQGKPLAEGRIVFTPDASQGGTGPTISCDIENGNFSGRVTSGAKKVEIFGSWETGEMVQEPSEVGEGTIQVPVIESIPDKYNELSEIKTEIKAEANEGLSFDLE